MQKSKFHLSKNAKASKLPFQKWFNQTINFDKADRFHTIHHSLECHMHNSVQISDFFLHFCSFLEFLLQFHSIFGNYSTLFWEYCKKGLCPSFCPLTPWKLRRKSILGSIEWTRVRALGIFYCCPFGPKSKSKFAPLLSRPTSHQKKLCYL